MSIATDFVVGLREAFTLRHALRAAEADGDARRAEARRWIDAAKTRRAGARKLASAVTATSLLREALDLVLVAERVLRGESAEAPADLAAALEAAPPVVRDFAASRSPLHVDELPFAEADALRDALDEEITRRLRAMDARSTTAIQALQWGRLAAVMLAVSIVAATIVRDELFPRNVARDKPVLTSGLRNETKPEGAVDGRTRGTFGVYTNESRHPFVTVDLQKVYGLTRIRIFNRGDGWFDESLPLVVEISDDGVRWHELARRTEHFDIWSILPADGTRARFVRVAKPVPGYIALNEIEVYSRE